MIISAAAEIAAHEEQINELNVFPVPDGDTGTNMSLTIGAGAAELRKDQSASVGAVAQKAANALLRSARGNSGVILSLLYRGMAKSLKEKETADAADITDALKSGVAAAYKAVMKPAEGTILTVSRVAAESAEGVESTDVEELFAVLIDSAEEALRHTVEQNPVLKKAGVVDAGGMGYIYMLRGMLASLRGEFVDSGEAAVSVSEKATFSDFSTEDITFAYCTEFIVERENVKSPDVLREYLATVGDSIVFVEDDELIKVHVHTNEPGNVLTRALPYGSFLTVKIENMRKQHTEKIFKEGETEAAAAAPEPVKPEKRFGIVTVCAGEGMASLFRDLGADGVITGGQTMNPSTEDILRRIEETPAETVFVLPNNKNIIMAAQQCESIATRKVIVIPTKTVPQGISAMLDMDLSREEGEIRESMEAAAGRVHTVLITYAARDSEFDGNSIKAGQYLALLENTLIANGEDIDEIFARTAEALQPFGPEIISVFYGEDVSEDTAEAAAERLSSLLPGAEVSAVEGGQPVYYYMISAE